MSNKPTIEQIDRMTKMIDELQILRDTWLDFAARHPNNYKLSLKAQYLKHKLDWLCFTPKANSSRTDALNHIHVYHKYMQELQELLNDYQI